MIFFSNFITSWNLDNIHYFVFFFFFFIVLSRKIVLYHFVLIAFGVCVCVSFDRQFLDDF